MNKAKYWCGCRTSFEGEDAPERCSLHNDSLRSTEMFEEPVVEEVQEEVVEETEDEVVEPPTEEEEPPSVPETEETAEKGFGVDYSPRS